MIIPRKIKELYEQGINISAWLRKELGVTHNTREIIEMSYDIQAGSYIESLKNAAMAKYKAEYTSEIAKVISSLCEAESVLEAGVGEATTLSGVLKHLDSNIKSYGFDISWSRVAYAKKWLKSQNIKNSTLCSGDLFNIPFIDNAIDIVYTSHSIEPNGGNESAILKELYRVARKYVVLLEPGYELTSVEAQKRMDSHGYCKNLVGISESLGYEVIKHELFACSGNQLNPTAITIICKQTDADRPVEVLACPKYKMPLIKTECALYSTEALVAYPIIDGIPCLRIENGILASKYQEVVLNN